VVYQITNQQAMDSSSMPTMVEYMPLNGHRIIFVYGSSRVALPPPILRPETPILQHGEPQIQTSRETVTSIHILSITTLSLIQRSVVIGLVPFGVRILYALRLHLPVKTMLQPIQGLSVICKEANRGIGHLLIAAGTGLLIQ
jgi:hypothetical protein